VPGGPVGATGRCGCCIAPTPASVAHSRQLRPAAAPAQIFNK
jgi:hypothetical protein